MTIPAAPAAVIVLRAAGWVAGLLALLLCGPLLTLAFGNASLHGDWRTASHRATGLAPDPATHPEAIVQVYASRTFGWRGAFAVHTWIAAKPARAAHYVRYEVIGWRGLGGGSTLSISDSEAPDAEWYGERPWVVDQLTGPRAEAVIARLPEVAQAYPWARDYRVWPGPNSNTFVAWVARSIPELGLALPALAIGKDYLAPGTFVARAPSGTGYQFSISGVAGLMVARDEGIEINLLGLIAGLDWSQPAIKFPGFGRFPRTG